MSGLSQYGRQSISDEDVRAVVDALRSDWLTTGPAVERFERALTRACDAPEAVACVNGTAGLMLAYAALGLSPGDRVLVPAITFAATATAALQLGAQVDLVDVEPDTGNMDLDALERAMAVGPAPKIVVPVHYGGRPVDLPRVAASAKRYGAAVVEDACHALGAHDGDDPIGAARHSACAVFSFHPVKTVTSAEGGAVLSRDPELARRVRLLRNHGIERSAERMQRPRQAFAEGQELSAHRLNPWYGELQELGWNLRLSDLHAALGASQMARLDAFVERRHALVTRYDEALAGLPLVRTAPPVVRGRSAHHLYVVRIDFEKAGRTRAEVMEGLRELGVGTQVHYVPLSHQPLMQRRCGARVDDYPGANRFYAGALTLPLHPSLTNEEVERAAEALKNVLG